MTVQPRRTTVRRWLRRHAVAIGMTGGGLLLAVEVVLARNYLVAAARAVTGARPGWIVAAVLATALSMQCLARAQRRMLAAADPGLRSAVSVRRMLALVYSANALNATLPAGSAVSVAFVLKRLRGWGSTSAAAGFTVLASGLLSSMTFLALVAAWGLGAGTLVVVAGCGLATVGAVRVVARRRSRPAGAARAATPTDRPARLLAGVERGLARVSGRWAEAWSGAVDGMRAVHPRHRDWIAGSGLAAVNWLADFGCLVASSAAVGVPVTTPTVLLAAYVAGMTASSVAVLPGGFGVVEVAMVGALHAGGVAVEGATAAVLLYRAISCVLVVVVGWLLLSRHALTAPRELQQAA